jgi:dolichyl-phosphate-mannose--protein O-mannosyl transferase
MKKQTVLLFLILFFSLVVRFFNLATPQEYYFDEVYHAVTAKAYAVNNPAGYEWWHDAPEPGTAYEWLHPPIGKLFMAAGWLLFGQTPLSWRIPGILFGAAVIYLTCWLTKLLTNKEAPALMAALLASLDGLLLSQSRIGMNDIYVTFFVLLTVGLYIIARRSVHEWRWMIATAVAAGLAMSTKWSGVFTLGMIGTWELGLWLKTGRAWLRRLPRLLVIFGILPICIYVLSYLQFWLQGHTIGQFYELHQQIWWYQTHLEATHAYQSKAWEWPLSIRPVWYWVHYYDNGTIANIYNLGNPVVFWLGLVTMVGLLGDVAIGWKKIKDQVFAIPMVVLIAYMWTWMPWLLSPRIMFSYHYTPAVPFLCIALGMQLTEWLQGPKVYKILGFSLLGLIGIAFIWLSPMWLGIPLPESWWPYLFWLPTWK